LSVSKGGLNKECIVMQDNSAFPKKVLILVSLVQGLLLLLLHQSIEFEFWPQGNPEWLFCIYAMVLIGPTMLLLAIRDGKELIVLKWTFLFTLLAGMLGFYVGYQALPLENPRLGSLLPALIFTMSIATFKALMYVQQFASGEKLSYSQLFRWSWRNFLIFGLAALFASLTWGVLMLWGGLFKAIKIDFFHELFTKPWFYYPVIGVANGFGIIMFRNLTNVIDTITRIQQALMKYLLVLLVLVSILFIFALPFTGLDPLWESGGSQLIFWMQALMLFFVNAVYQDDPELRPYTLWIHRFIYAGIILLPIYSAISLYGLYLRIDQYGWSIDRCWAGFIWILLASFSVGYVWGILKYRDDWIFQLSKVNVAMGLVMLALLLIVNSPAVDFREITTASQVERLENGQVELDELDLNYFKNSLARPGYLALQAVKEEYQDINKLVVVKITNLYADSHEDVVESSKEEVLAAIEIISGEVSSELGNRIYRHLTNKSWTLRNVSNLYLIETNLAVNGTSEYLLVQKMEHRTELYLFHIKAAVWVKSQVIQHDGGYGQYDTEFFDALKAGQIDEVEVVWKDFQIGGKKFRVIQK
jgi:hypothetical protein